MACDAKKSVSQNVSILRVGNESVDTIGTVLVPWAGNFQC